MMLGEWAFMHSCLFSSAENSKLLFSNAFLLPNNKIEIFFPFEGR